MSAGSLQAALAHVLVDDGARAALRDAPTELQRRLGLTDEQLAVLRSLDAQRLELTAGAGRAKRLDFLRRGLPYTLRALELGGMHAVLHDFVRTTWAPIQPGDARRALSEGRRFAKYLDTMDAAGSLGWIRDLAAFELVKLDLLAAREASDWARLAPGRSAEVRRLLEHGLEAMRDRRVMLGRHVRVATFAYDIVGLSTALGKGMPDGVAHETTHVTLVKRPEPPPLAIYRTGEVVAAMLRLCAEPRRLAEVLAAGVGHGRQQAEETARRVLSDGTLLVVEADSAP